VSLPRLQLPTLQCRSTAFCFSFNGRISPRPAGGAPSIIDIVRAASLCANYQIYPLFSLTGIVSLSLPSSINTDQSPFLSSSSPSPSPSSLCLSQQVAVIGRLVTCRAATNCRMPSRTGPDGSSPSKKIVSRPGNTSVVLPPTSSCRAGAIIDANRLDRYRFFTLVNRCNSSSHAVISMFWCDRFEFRCKYGAS
jgi:hypothetical protein